MKMLNYGAGGYDPQEVDDNIVSRVAVRKTVGVPGPRVDKPGPAGPFIVFCVDDGEETQVGFFDLLDTKGVRGTLFLPPLHVNDAGYLSTAEVQAIADAGHELGTHGKNHEQFPAYLAANGAAALHAMLVESKELLEDAYGVSVRTGAYPGSDHSLAVMEIVARSHDFFRSGSGSDARNGLHPYRVGVREGTLPTEQDLTDDIDNAVTNGQLLVFGWHGGIDQTQLTKIGNLIDYALGLGVRVGTFYEGMRDRTAFVSPNVHIDFHGNLACRSVKTYDLEIGSDQLGDYILIAFDEATGVAYLDQSGNIAFEFRKRVKFIDNTTFAGSSNAFETDATFQAINNIFQPTGDISDSEFFVRFRRSASKASNPGVDVCRLDQLGRQYLRGPQSRLSVAGVDGAEKAALTYTGTLLLWDTGTSTLKTGTLTNGTLAFA